MIKRKLFYPEQLLSFDGGRAFLNGQTKVSITPITIVLTIRSEVPLEMDVLQHAVCQLQKKHPALRARVSDGYILYTDEVINPFPIRVIDRENDLTWQSVEQDETTALFDFRNEPLLHIAWVCGAGAVSELMITCLHAIVDGRSLLILFAEMIALLNEPNRAMLPYEPFLSLDDFMPGRPLNSRENREAFIWAEMRKWSAIWRSIFRKKHINNKSPYCESLFLDFETTKVLESLAKEHRVSVGNLFCTIFLKLFQKHLYPQRTEALAFVPVDLRRYFHRIRRDMLFSFSAMHRIQIRMTPDSDIWERAQAFEKQLIEKVVLLQRKADDAQSPTSLFKGIRYLNHCGRVVRSLIRYNVTRNEGQYFHFSNFGKCPMQGKGPHYGLIQSFRVTLPWINPTYVGMLESAGRLAINLISDEACIPQAKLIEIKEDFQYEISTLLTQLS